jgi:hypothetical protein
LELKRRIFSATVSAGAQDAPFGAEMSEFFRPVRFEQRRPGLAGRESRETVMAHAQVQARKGSAFNILFSASFFASFVYVMLHFG